MCKPKANVAWLCVALLWAGASAKAVVVAQYDLAQHNSNGFAFSDFNDFDALDISGTAGDFIRLNVANDLDGSNGIFGGIGSDIAANFNAASSQIEVTLRVNPGNTATDFRVVLADDDGLNESEMPTGEEFQFFFDLTGVTPGEFVTLVQPMLVPGPVFSQTAFNREPGDGVQNYGLFQIQLQSTFGGTNPLVIDLESIKISDTENPVLAELTPATYDAACCSFTFGTFSPDNQATAFDASGENFIINADSAGTGGPDGGFGFSGISLDFEPTQFQLEVEVKLLSSNTSGGFNLLLGDNDGDVDGNGTPDQEDYTFFIDTALFEYRRIHDHHHSPGIRLRDGPDDEFSVGPRRWIAEFRPVPDANPGQRAGSPRRAGTRNRADVHCRDYYCSRRL